MIKGNDDEIYAEAENNEGVDGGGGDEDEPRLTIKVAQTAAASAGFFGGGPTILPPPSLNPFERAMNGDDPDESSDRSDSRTNKKSGAGGSGKVHGGTASGGDGGPEMLPIPAAVPTLSAAAVPLLPQGKRSSNFDRKANTTMPHGMLPPPPKPAEDDNGDKGGDSTREEGGAPFNPFATGGGGSGGGSSSVGGDTLEELPPPTQRKSSNFGREGNQTMPRGLLPPPPKPSEGKGEDNGGSAGASTTSFDPFAAVTGAHGADAIGELPPPQSRQASSNFDRKANTTMPRGLVPPPPPTEPTEDEEEDADYDRTPEPLAQMASTEALADAPFNPFAAAMQKSRSPPLSVVEADDTDGSDDDYVDDAANAFAGIAAAGSAEPAPPSRKPAPNRGTSNPVTSSTRAPPRATTAPSRSSPSSKSGGGGGGGGGRGGLGGGGGRGGIRPSPSTSQQQQRESYQKRVGETERFWNFSTRPHQQAYSQLERRPAGAFLIRSSREKGFCTMSTRVGNKTSIWNGRIRKRRSGFSLTVGGMGKEPLPTIYPTLVDLIVDCVVSPPEIKPFGLPVRLQLLTPRPSGGSSARSGAASAGAGRGRGQGGRGSGSSARAAGAAMGGRRSGATSNAGAAATTAIGMGSKSKAGATRKAGTVGGSGATVLQANPT